MTFRKTRGLPQSLLRLLLVVTFALAMPAMADGFPRPFEASYSVAFNGKDAGMMTRTLRHDGDVYLFDSDLKATHGLFALIGVRIHESSRWRLQGEQAVALEFHSRQSGLKKRESTARFDWSRNVVAVEHKKKHGELAAEPGMTDKLLYQLLLMRDLSASKRPIRYTVVDGNKVRDYPIEIVGDERIDTPMGRLDTVKVRYSKAGSDRTTTLWCAKSLGYLPVRLDHREDADERTEALIQSFQWK